MARNKKLLILLSLTLVFIMVLTGCGNNTSEVGENEGPVEGSTEGKPEGSSDDKWPVEPIRVILPAAPGGSLDVGIRQMQPYFEEILGVPFLIDSRPGGQNMIAANLIAEAKPDGYTIGNMGFPHTEMSFATMDTDLTFDDYDCIGIHEGDVGILRVHDDSEFQTFGELLDYAIENPGGISVSVSQMIGPHTFYMLQLAEAIGTEFNIVDFGGGNPARTALLGKHVDLCCTNVNASMPIDEGTRVIAVMHDENLWPEFTDDAPTANEVLEEKYGVTVPNMGVYYGLIAPAGFKEQYPERYEKLCSAYESVVHNPEYIKYLEELEQDIKLFWMDSEEMTKMVNDNYKLYTENKALFDGMY